jgi:hypothetical protein
MNLRDLLLRIRALVAPARVRSRASARCRLPPTSVATFAASVSSTTCRATLRQD